MCALLQLSVALRTDTLNTVGSCNDWVGFTANQFLVLSLPTQRVYDTPCSNFTVAPVNGTNLFLVVVDVKGSGCSRAVVDELVQSPLAFDACPNTFANDAATPACPPQARAPSVPLVVDTTGLAQCFACNPGMPLQQCRDAPECTPNTRVTASNQLMYVGCSFIPLPNNNSCPLYATSRAGDTQTAGTIGIGVGVGCAGILIVIVISVTLHRRLRPPPLVRTAVLRRREGCMCPSLHVLSEQ